MRDGGADVCAVAEERISPAQAVGAATGDPNVTARLRDVPSLAAIVGEGGNLPELMRGDDLLTAA